MDPLDTLTGIDDWQIISLWHFYSCSLQLIAENYGAR